MMFFSKTDQVIYLDYFSIIGDDAPAVAPEHLVHLAGNDLQIGTRHPHGERHEIERQPACIVDELPRLLVVRWIVLKLDLPQLMYPPL